MSEDGLKNTLDWAMRHADPVNSAVELKNFADDYFSTVGKFCELSSFAELDKIDWEYIVEEQL